MSNMLTFILCMTSMQPAKLGQFCVVNDFTLNICQATYPEITYLYKHKSLERKFKIQFCRSHGLLEMRKKCKCAPANGTVLGMAVARCCSSVRCCRVTAMWCSGTSCLRHGQTIIPLYTEEQKYFNWILRRNNIPRRQGQDNEYHLLSCLKDLSLKGYMTKRSINYDALLSWCPAVWMIFMTFKSISNKITKEKRKTFA